LQRYFSLRKLNQSYTSIMETIAPLDDKKYPQLQAADVMAHMAKERYLEWTVDPQPESAKPDLNSRLRDLGVNELYSVPRERLVAALKHEVNRRGLSV
jgi:hypothetical protein